MGKMDRERYIRIQNGAEDLTPEEVEDGWHFCPEWDDMLIHADDDEFQCCPCSWMKKYRTPERQAAYEKRREEWEKSQEALDILAQLDEDLGLNNEPNRKDNSGGTAE
jgi:hypothetical protein